VLLISFLDFCKDRLWSFGLIFSLLLGLRSLSRHGKPLLGGITLDSGKLGILQLFLCLKLSFFLLFFFPLDLCYGLVRRNVAALPPCIRFSGGTVSFFFFNGWSLMYAKLLVILELYLHHLLQVLL